MMRKQLEIEQNYQEIATYFQKYLKYIFMISPFNIISSFSRLFNIIWIIISKYK